MCKSFAKKTSKNGVLAYLTRKSLAV